MAEKGVSLDPFQRIVEVGWKPNLRLDFIADTHTPPGGGAGFVTWYFLGKEVGAGWPGTDNYLSTYRGQLPPPVVGKTIEIEWAGFTLNAEGGVITTMAVFTYNLVKPGDPDTIIFTTKSGAGLPVMTSTPPRYPTVAVLKIDPFTGIGSF